MIKRYKIEILLCKFWVKTLSNALILQVQTKKTLVFSKSLCENLQEHQNKLGKVRHLFTLFFVVHNKI